MLEAHLKSSPPTHTLEAVLRSWIPTLRTLDETSQTALNILYQHEVQQARRLCQPRTGGGWESITNAEWVRRATEELRRPAGDVVEVLIKQCYASVELYGCVLKCDGYDVFESRSFVYSKLMLSLCGLIAEKGQQTQVRLTELANLSGINLDAAGHHTKFLDRMGLIHKENWRDPDTQKYKTNIGLTELGQQFMDYFNSARAAPYRSPLLPAWQAEIKGLLASR